VSTDEEWHSYVEPSSTVSSGFFDVFTFDFVEGSIEEMAPGTIIIPLSLSHRLFGGESAIGKHIFHSEQGPQTVIAVYRDFPSNAFVQNHIFSVMQPDDFMNWRFAASHVFVRVNQTSNMNALIDNFKRSFDGKAAWGEDFDWEESGRDMRFIALTDIPFTRDVEADNTPKENRQTLTILFIIAIMIVGIAGINFTNFSTALMPMRVRNINTQRVMGAQRSTIRLMLIFEASIFCLMSYFVALLLVKLLGGGALTTLINADLSLAANLKIVSGTALVAISVGICAGLYPSYYITSFAPALALKGNFGLSPKGKRIRNTLIGIQFIASLALIIGASFMFLQNRLMQNADLGFSAEGLITVNVGRVSEIRTQETRDLFTHKLTLHSGIKEVSYAQYILSSSDHYERWARSYEGEEITVELFPVQYNFLDVLGIDITEGRGFRREDTGSSGVMIFNESARRRYNMELGTTFLNSEIIGFVPDIHFGTFRVAVAPMTFGVIGRGWNYAYVRMEAGADRHAVVSHIRSALAEFDPNFYSFFDIRFFDEVLQQAYERELKSGWLVLILSLLVVFISIVGVFGLVVFDSECRRKEIGIRKVLGSSTIDIILIFNKTYLKILAICFVIAVPLAWYAVSRWLENFAYRTPMYWWVYLLAFIAVAVITILTVTIQNWRVANDDLIKSIKTE
jgi:putative ABC transport system permease protein